MRNLLDEGYITGIKITDNAQIRGLELCQITPQGIAYICDDYILDKARDYISDRKDIPKSIY